ncbi:SURF1 family protein [uncultured Roseibium sp.]|uniref:SURF1 family protein n=1 Tax=uncultured Roseibium sp. TaxID=1936171 RepID=UPI0026356FDA|nr:SURF1 family protein [uncultured Roseibium sp.]
MDGLKKLVVPAIAAVLALGILLNLGFWQLNRLEWKQDLISKVEAGVTKPPVDAPAPRSEKLGDEFDYLRVKVTGEYLDGNTFYYTSLSDPVGRAEGPGLMTYAPFRTLEGWTVLINRGFMPQGLDDPAREAALDAPGGQLELTGLLRLSEQPNWTTPTPDASDRIWFARDTGAMAQVLGLENQTVAPYSIDIDASYTPEGGFPQAGETIVRFKNDHLGYALTWFGLAATLIGVFLTYAASVLWPRNKTLADD